MRCRITAFLLLCGSTGCSSLLGDFTLSAKPDDGGLASDDAGRGGVGASDAGAVDAGDEAIATVQAITSDVSVYVGQTATVDASRSTTTQGALTFAWTLTSVPPASSLTTTALTGARSSTVSFVPDAAGDYVLRVTALGLGASDTRSATVTATAPQVLFAQGVVAPGAVAGQPEAHYTVADLNGGNAHPVLCPEVFNNAQSQIEPALYAAYAGRAYDFWEAPPGKPSKFAAFTIEYGPDGFSTHLWTGTTLSSCSAPPADLGVVGFGPDRPYGSQPHFNPDGTSFVVFDRKWRIVTYATNGLHPPNVVAAYPVPYGQASLFLDPVGLDPKIPEYSFEPPRVAWTANGLGLAWAQPTVDGWEIVTAPDMPNQTPTPYMTCTGVTPREIAMLTDGTVLASYRRTPQASENLYQLKPDAQQNCSQEHQYTNLTGAGASIATDFAVSPDGTQIAFLQIDTSLQDAAPWMQGSSQLPGGYVYVVSVSGGSPRQIASEPALYGPRWVGGGTSLVFTRLDGVAPSTGKPATSVVAISPDGGAESVIAQGDGVGTFVSTSGNAACSVAAGATGIGAARSAETLWLLAMVAPCVCRRRLRQSVP